MEMIPIYPMLPTGWKVLIGATTAPHGYVWCSNGESRFSPGYRHGLIKDRRQQL